MLHKILLTYKRVPAEHLVGSPSNGTLVGKRSGGTHGGLRGKGISRHNCCFIPVTDNCKS